MEFGTLRVSPSELFREYEGDFIVAPARLVCALAPRAPPIN